MAASEVTAASKRPRRSALTSSSDIVRDVLVVLEEEGPDGGEADPEGGPGAALDGAGGGLVEGAGDAGRGHALDLVVLLAPLRRQRVEAAVDDRYRAEGVGHACT